MSKADNKNDTPDTVEILKNVSSQDELRSFLNNSDVDKLVWMDNVVDWLYNMDTDKKDVLKKHIL